MGVKWMRLDVDFWHDPKFVTLRRIKNDAMAFRVLQLYCIATANGGFIDLNDPMQVVTVEEELGVKGKRLTNLLETLAGFKIFDPEELANGTVTNDRLKEEADIAQSFREQRQRAAQIRWKKAKNNA